MAKKIKCDCGITFTAEEGQTHCNYCGKKLSDIGKEKTNINTKRTIKNTIENEIPKKFLIILLALLILFSAYFYVRAENNEKNLKKDFTSNLEPTPTALPTPTPTTKPKVYVNPDPIIPCTMSKECGGDIRNIKKSECTNGTCCQIGSTWIFYPSRDKCLQDQKASQPVQQVQQPAQATSKLNYYCYDNTYKYWYYTSSGEQCNLDNLKSIKYKTCMDTQMIKYNSCKSTCESGVEKDKAACVWAYTGSNAGIEQNPDKYEECLLGPGGATETHGTCLGKCTDQYGQDIKKCSL